MFYYSEFSRGTYTNRIYIKGDLFIRLAYMIRDWIVPQWLSANCTAGETSGCLVQEAGILRKRGTSDAVPVED